MPLQMQSPEARSLIKALSTDLLGYHGRQIISEKLDYLFSR